MKELITEMKQVLQPIYEMTKAFSYQERNVTVLVKDKSTHNNRCIKYYNSYRKPTKLKIISHMGGAINAKRCEK